MCSSSRPTRTNVIDQSLNHVSYNTSRIKTVRILTVGTKKTRRERNKKSYDSSNTGLINQTINMVSDIESINSKAVNNCRNNMEARKTKTLIKFCSVYDKILMELFDILKYLPYSNWS